MLIGIVGAPNKGKSTIFSALTMNDVPIADYPFTTIKPNLGVAYATKKCVHEELKTKCKARNSLCADGIRMFPVNLTDVAGLVEGAHEGKGMGNQFLNDLASADALILVADVSGRTDPSGNKTTGADPAEDVRMVEKELVEWLAGVVRGNISKISRRPDGIDALYEVLAGLKVTKDDIKTVVEANGLPSSKISWTDKQVMEFSIVLIKRSKPTLIAANKSDVPGSEANVEKLRKEFGEGNVIPCSGAMELALRKAAKQKLIDYISGSREFKWLHEGESKERQEALKYMQNFLKTRGTNLQELINGAVFGLLDNIAVYPVEDENKYTDSFGNVLPDAILIKRGSTALQFAEKIHTDLAKGMLYAVDARTKRRLSKDYILQDNDVIKIVSAAK